jgi:hypothetical protein
MTVQEKLNKANQLNGMIASNFNAIKNCEKIKGKAFERVDLINSSGRRDCYSIAMDRKYSDLIMDTLIECMKKDMEDSKQELELLFK